MPDLSHLWGNDLAWSPTGDLATADTPAVTQQRVLRRLLTSPAEYIWALDYGAGLATFVGQPGAASAIRAAIRGQIFKEAAVAQTPAPVIDLTPTQPAPSTSTSATPTRRPAPPKRSPSRPDAKDQTNAAPLQDFTTLVRTMAASVQGSARILLDLTAGSVLRAILEANASVALWLQWLIVQVLAPPAPPPPSGPTLTAGSAISAWPACPASRRPPRSPSPASRRALPPPSPSARR